MTMTAKYNGKCRVCGKAIRAGEKIEWTKAGGARHLNCESSSNRVSTASMVAPTSRRKASNGKATDRQVRYAMRLLGRLGARGWHDTDMGSTPMPTESEVYTMGSREISDIIANCKCEF